MAVTSCQSISVVFPAYDEQDNIEKAVEQVIGFVEPLFRDWEVIVVDDGSRDRTGALIDELAQREPRVVALHHPRNLGYGAALQSGIAAASKDLVFFSDSDLQFHLSEVLLLLAWMQQYDMVIGYRSRRVDPLHRKLNAWGWNRLVRLALGLRVRDIDCAFKLFRRDVFRAIQIQSVGAMVNTEILVKATRMGFKIKEIPVTHFPRQAGSPTGAKLRVIVKAFKELGRLYVTLRDTRPVVAPYDRRASKGRPDRSERRRQDRRQSDLPMNFPDRRRRILLEPVAEVRHPSHVPASANGRPTRTKVAMVVACPFPADHGTPGSIREMAEALTARGLELHVVTYHFGAGVPPAGVHIHRTPRLWFSSEVSVGPSMSRLLIDFLMVFKLIGVLRRHHIDVIHAHNYEGALVGFLGRLLTGKPLIYNAINTMRDELPSYRFVRPQALATGLARVLDYLVPRGANRVICISDELVSFLHAEGISPERLHRVPLGITTAAFDGHDGSAVRERFGLGEAPVVVYTGTLDRFQRIDYLLHAMHIVAQKVPDARLLIGTNLAKEGDLDECRRLVRELGLEARVVIASAPFEDVPRFLAAGDVAVVPRPNCPGYPVKLLNYMAASRPIVVFEGSAKGLQHMREAMVVEDDDWRGFADALVMLLRDSTLACELGRNARRYADENLSWERLALETERVYAEVLRG